MRLLEFSTAVVALYCVYRFVWAFLVSYMPDTTREEE
jgi:hypothetical protein